MKGDGPLYGVELPNTIGIAGTGMIQELPSEQDLRQVLPVNQRVVAGYEVLVDHMRARDFAFDEVRDVLAMLDGLAQQWGDEGVFRRCRDRLRAVVENSTKFTH